VPKAPLIRYFDRHMHSSLLNNSANDACKCRHVGLPLLSYNYRVKSGVCVHRLHLKISLESVSHQ